jgi:hypothetical protein
MTTAGQRNLFDGSRNRVERLRLRLINHREAK